MAALRTAVIAAGLAWAAAFVVVGFGTGLQMYADGSIFSYAVAVEDAWTFHLRNISGRLFVYLFAFVPGEATVALTGSASAGIAVYGFMQFAAPSIGLAATYAADRSPDRVIFATACASTASLCPLVFGFPTEMWMAHAVFWPALAVCHHARNSIAGTALAFLALAALVLTHEGAVILALAILATLLLRGLRDAVFLRGLSCFVAAMAVWGTVKATIRPDDYFGSIVGRAAFFLIDPTNLTVPVFLLLLAALAGHGAVFLLLQRIRPAYANVAGAAIVAAALAAYWLWFDRSLNADDRYPLRTALLLGTPIFGIWAAAFALNAAGRLSLPVPLLPQALTALARPLAVRAALGAFAVVMLVHAVETAKFATAWTDYKAAVRALAMSAASDPELGDGRFVSSARIVADVNRLRWFSTTPYLSVLLAPGLAPTRLVVDPMQGNYHWLSCPTATANETAARAIPADSRRLVRIYNCLQRP